MPRHAVVRTGEPPDWRDVPEQYVGELAPNHFCRAWNGKRGKYCRAEAGKGTDHAGVGRCRHHGGSTPSRHGIYSVVQRERLADLIAHFEAAADPLDTLPELAAGRALFVDFIERYDEFREALLAWHASFAQRPIPEPLRIAFESVLEEYEILLAEQSGATERQAEYLALARKFVAALADGGQQKPMKVVDIADAHRILDTISKIAERYERARALNAVSRKDLLRIMSEMGVSVRTRVQDLCEMLRNKGYDLTVEVDGRPVDVEQHTAAMIRDDWRRIRLA